MNPEPQSQFSLLEWGITPWTVLLVALLPLFLLTYYQSTFPTRRLILLASVPVLLALPLPWLPAWWWRVVAVSGATLAVHAVLDLLTLPATHRVELKREMLRVGSFHSRHTCL